MAMPREDVVRRAHADQTIAAVARRHEHRVVIVERGERRGERRIADVRRVGADHHHAARRRRAEAREAAPHAFAEVVALLRESALPRAPTNGVEIGIRPA